MQSGRFSYMSAKPKQKSRSLPSMVMILEPDVLVRASLAEYLHGCGFKVIEGQSSEEVFRVLDSDIKVDIVFAEARLAGDLTGLELAKRVRAQYPGIDVILTSGIANAADRAGDLCEEGPLDQPFHPQELLRRIHILKERRRTSQPS